MLGLKSVILLLVFCLFPLFVFSYLPVGHLNIFKEKWGFSIGIWLEYGGYCPEGSLLQASPLAKGKRFFLEVFCLFVWFLFCFVFCLCILEVSGWRLRQCLVQDIWEATRKLRSSPPCCSSSPEVPMQFTLFQSFLSFMLCMSRVFYL